MVDVSAVIPCFNGSRVLPRALESVCRQSEPPREVVVVDDGSEDQAAIEMIVGAVKAPFPVRLLSFSRNRGASAARNAGVDEARARYVAFLDADDVWHPRKLELQFAAVTRERLVMCGHGYARVDRSGFVEEPPAAPRLVPIRLGSFVARNPFFTPTVMVEKAAFAGFDERLRRADDYKAWVLTCVGAAGRVGRLDAVLAGGFKPFMGASGLTASLSEMHRASLAAMRSLRADAPSIPRGFVASAVLIEQVKYPIRIARIALHRVLER